jgi:hypothetical protein
MKQSSIDCFSTQWQSESSTANAFSSFSNISTMPYLVVSYLVLLSLIIVL